jgi:7-cyano-7-deazaguanine reductase
MALEKLDNSNISVHLGKTSQYKSQYDPSLLVRELRSNNRKHIGIDDDNLPFVGYDTWNAYEISALTNNGLPVTGIAKIVYPASSKYIVESKSLKLYFNSFNMTKLGVTSSEVRSKITELAIKDLSELLGVDVSINVFSDEEVVFDHSMLHIEYYEDCITLEKHYEHSLTDEFTVYQETPSLLEITEGDNKIKKFHSALLKSNCRVTSQPDWGDVFIVYKSSKDVDPVSLVKYIVSFRDECHFHEEICETIYKRLHDALQPELLHVMCLYARRGGIDINPQRASSDQHLHGIVDNPAFCHTKTPKQ